MLFRSQYDDYLQNLTKKNRHELSRKKRKFSDQVDSFELLESCENEIFKIFVSQHKKSKGEKGKFMTKVLVLNKLLNQGHSIFWFLDNISFYFLLSYHVAITV